MPLAPEDVAFLNGPFKAIEGWCYDDAAWFTTDLLRYQQRQNRIAPSFEIGVCYGKYLSVLRNAALATGSSVFGFDTYEWVPLATVEQEMRKAFGNLDGIHLIPGDSTKMSPADLASHLGGSQVGFVSIDGSHTPDAVYSDLTLTEPVLAPWGVVAIDDFINPMALGVTDGTMRYFYESGTDLVPFCFCSNKLFAAHKAFADEYSGESLRFAEENTHLSGAKLMVNNMRTHGLHWAKQDFLGRGVWIIHG